MHWVQVPVYGTEGAFTASVLGSTYYVVAAWIWAIIWHFGLDPIKVGGGGASPGPWSCPGLPAALAPRPAIPPSLPGLQWALLCALVDPPPPPSSFFLPPRSRCCSTPRPLHPC